MPMLTAGVTLETVPALVFLSAVMMLMISGALFVMNLWQRRENEHLHAELYAWRKFGDSVEFVDERSVIASAPVRKPRPIPEGLEVIHPAKPSE